MTTLHFSNQKLIPKLHILNLVAQDKQGQAHLFFHSCITVSKQDAYIAALKTMERTIPELYHIGQVNDGFEIATHRVYSYSELQHSFRKEIDKNERPNIKPIDIIVTPDLDQPEGIEVVEDTKKNRLIKKIIAKGTEKYLEKHAHKLTAYEVAYIRDQIKTAQ